MQVSNDIWYKTVFSHLHRFFNIKCGLKCIEKGLAGNSTQGGVGWGRGGGVTT